MAFLGFGQTSRLLTRMDQSIDVYNRKIANIQSKIDALTFERASIYNSMLQMKEIEEMLMWGTPGGGI